MNTLYHIDYSTPQLFLAIHNGHRLSPHIANKIGISEADRLREEDPYTERFICDKANHIIQYTSRFEYDLNRRRDSAVYQKPDDCWGLPIYPNEKLTPEEINSSLANYDIFYKELTKVIENFLNKYEKLLIWDIHSYNHRRGGIDSPFDNPAENPEIILGTNHYKYMGEQWKPFVETIEANLRGQTLVGAGLAPTHPNRPLPLPHLDVRQNIKFPGGYLSQYLNHTYHDRVCCIAIEFKKIWMNEWTGEVDEPCFQAIKTIFDKCVVNIQC